MDGDVEDQNLQLLAMGLWLAIVTGEGLALSTMIHYAARFTRLLGPGAGPGRGVDARSRKFDSGIDLAAAVLLGLPDPTKRSSESDFECSGLLSVVGNSSSSKP